MMAGSPDTYFKLDTPKMIVAKFGLFGPVVLEEKIFVNDNQDLRKMVKN